MPKSPYFQYPGSWLTDTAAVRCANSALAYIPAVLFGERDKEERERNIKMVSSAVTPRPSAPGGHSPL